MADVSSIQQTVNSAAATFEISPAQSVAIQVRASLIGPRRWPSSVARSNHIEKESPWIFRVDEAQNSRLDIVTNLQFYDNY